MKRFLFFIVCLFFFISQSTIAQTTYTWNGGSDIWENASAWTPAGVPGSGDIAVVGIGTIMLSGNVTVAEFRYSGGIFSGDGNLTVSDSMSWIGGNFETGNGEVIIGSGASLFISGGTKLLRRVLRNRGSAVWTGNSLITNSAGGGLINEGTFEIQTDVSLGSQGSTVNNGLMIKSVGTVKTSITNGFTNNGTVQILTGTLELTAGSSGSGSYEVASGGALLLPSGNHSLDGNSFSGAGTLDMTAATITVGPGGLSLPFGISWILSGATIQGDGPIDVEGTFTWNSGSLGTTDTVTVATGATFNISSSSKILRQVLVNNADAQWNGGSILMNAADAVLINNGSLDFNLDIQLGSQGRTINNGLFVKSGGASTSTISNEFTNNGTLLILSGTLSIPSNFENSLTGLIGGTGTFSKLSGSFINDGTFAPGASAGILTYTGNYPMTASAGLEIEIGGPNPGSDHDRLDVSNAATLDGTMQVNFIDGFLPQIGDTFTVMNYGLRSGEFTDIQFSNNYDGTLDYRPNSLLLEITNDGGNRLPSQPLLLTPPDQFQIVDLADPLLFTWNRSVDPDGDPLNYTLHIFGAGLDSSFTPQADTTLSFLGGGILQSANQYQWRVLVSDGVATVASDTFSFFTPFQFQELDLIAQGVIGLAGSAVWGDYDNDGDPDFAITGRDMIFSYSRVYRNDGGTFSDVNAGLAPLSEGDAAWGDYDNDGDLDLALTGYPLNPSDGAEAHIYRNDGGIFTDIGAGLDGITDGLISWVDYDNDGDLDIFLSGSRFLLPNVSPFSRIYRNDNGNFTEISSAIPGRIRSAAAWGDVDNDGDPDLILAGLDSTIMNAFSRLYINSNGAFSEVDAGFPGVGPGAVVWGDYDSDGDLDLLLTGLMDTGTTVSHIFQNNGGSFSDIGAGLQGASVPSAAWGDYDNDGDLDVALSGVDGNPIRYVGHLYRNDAGVFTSKEALRGLAGGSFSWGDYDNDNDLDLLATGLDSSNSYQTLLYQNLSAVANSLPQAPTDLLANPVLGQLFFGWSPGGDAETPTEGLSYNLRIGTTPGGSEIVSAMSLPSGQRSVSAMGNVGQDTTWVLKKLLPRRYYWSVQTVDNGYAGSEFAPEQSLVIPRVRQVFRRGGLNRVINPLIRLRDTLRVILPLEFTSDFRISDVNLTIDSLQHTNVDDLSIILKHAGISDTLVFGLSSGGQDFLGTVLDDSATVLLNQGSPPYSGVFRPYRPLSQLNLLDPEGEWILEVFDAGTGNSGVLNAWSIEVTFDAPTGIAGDADPVVPENLLLEQNYPNPFNPATQIRFAIPAAGQVKLELYNVLGQHIAVLLDEQRPAGYHTLNFRAENLPSGVYLYRLEDRQGNAVTRKMLLLK